MGLLACLCVLTAASCDRGTESPLTPASGTDVTLAGILTGASVGDVQGLARTGDVPSSGAGPVITASGNTTVVNGGTMVVNVSSATPFTVVYVSVAAKTVGLNVDGGGTIGGFYEIRLPAATTSAAVLLSFPQTVALNQFSLLFGSADSSDRVGPFTNLETTVTLVGTGDVQVTLSWDADSDVDLHVIDPSGEETYWAHRNSATGGQLDLDSNAACSIDGVRNENITWPVGQAPRGTYTVRVDYWDACAVSRTNYTVRINSGGASQVFTGFFTGPGDQGGQGSGRFIATFERVSGTAPPAEVKVVLEEVSKGRGRAGGPGKK